VSAQSGIGNELPDEGVFLLIGRASDPAFIFLLLRLASTTRTILRDVLF